MSDATKKPERFTMLEARGPNNPPAGFENWRRVELAVKERFTMLPEMRPVEGANVGSG